MSLLNTKAETLYHLLITPILYLLIQVTLYMLMNYFFLLFIAQTHGRFSFYYTEYRKISVEKIKTDIFLGFHSLIKDQCYLLSMIEKKNFINFSIIFFIYIFDLNRPKRLFDDFQKWLQTHLVKYLTD